MVKLAGFPSRANDDRRIVAGVHIFKNPCGRFVFRVKKRSEEMIGRRLVNEAIDVADERGKIQMRMQRLRSERRLETGHQQGRANSFSGYISDGYAPTSIRQRNEIIVVAADSVGRLIKSFAGYTWNREVPWREERLLNIFCALQIPAKGSLKSRIGFGPFEKFQKRLDMIAQQESGFSSSSSVESIDNGLV